MGESIPKIIHYCWFGKKEKPKLIQKCIQSWKRQLPDYDIIEWNEERFDIHINTFVRQAYEAGKFAFVSDYVRVYALYHYGGIYLDTDVEVKRSFDPLLQEQSFWGFEQENFIATSTIGARKGNTLIKQFLDTYEGKSFLKANKEIDTLTNVAIVSELIQKRGVVLDGTYQQIDGLGSFYPQEYFSPYDYINCYTKASANVYTIHYFYKSWLPWHTRLKSGIKKVVARVVGGENVAKLRSKLSQ